MNTSTPIIRLGLFALACAVAFGATTLHQPSETVTTISTTAGAIPMLAEISVRPSADEIVAAMAPTLPILPTVHVNASEEERIAAAIDPTDSIQILSTITVTPSADEVALAMQTAVDNDALVSDEDESASFGTILSSAATGHHRLRLDMPYYSFGRVLTHSSK